MSGLITEAIKEVVIFLKAQGWNYIAATHDINNPASGKVVKKVGMTYKYTYKEQQLPKDILVSFRMYQLNLDNKDWTYDEH